MKHLKYLAACVVGLAVSASAPAGVSAQPPDPNPEMARQQENQRRADDWLRQVNEQEARERRTPAGALSQLARMVSQGALVAAAANVEGAVQGRDLQRLEAALMRTPSAWRIEVVPLTAQPPAKEAEFQARVAVSMSADGPLRDDPLLQAKTTFIERVTMKRDAAGEWKAVPRKALELPAPPGNADVPPQDVPPHVVAQAVEATLRAGASEDDGFLNAWARVLASPRPLLVKAVSRASMSNVKQVMLGALQFAIDNGEAFAFTQADMRDKLHPYTQKPAIFLAPALDEDKEFAYVLNPALANKKIAQIAEPARTVAIYEAGPDGKPLFRFGGKALIGYADGHVKIVGPTEAAGLVWNF